MRTTLDISEELLTEAQSRVHAPSKKALVEMGLRALLRQNAEERLASAGGSMPKLTLPGRRRVQ